MADKELPALTDRYIKKLLGLREAPQEFIELKRAQVMLKRKRLEKDREQVVRFASDAFIRDNIKCN